MDVTQKLITKMWLHTVENIIQGKRDKVLLLNVEDDLDETEPLDVTATCQMP